MCILVHFLLSLMHQIVISEIYTYYTAHSSDSRDILTCKLKLWKWQLLSMSVIIIPFSIINLLNAILINLVPTVLHITHFRTIIYIYVFTQSERYHKNLNSLYLQIEEKYREDCTLASKCKLFPLQKQTNYEYKHLWEKPTATKCFSNTSDQYQLITM